MRRLAPNDNGWRDEYRPAVNILLAATEAAKAAAVSSGGDTAAKAVLTPALSALIRKTVLADCVGPEAKEFARWAPKDGSAAPVPRKGVVEAAAAADAALPPISASAAATESAAAPAAEAPPAAEGTPAEAKA